MSICNYMKCNYKKVITTKNNHPNLDILNIQKDKSSTIILDNNKNTIDLLDIYQYSFNELLNVFDLKTDFTIDDLKKIRRQVLSLHPDKNHLISVEHYIFFKSAYELIETYYRTIKKQTMELPSEEIHYEPEFTPKNQTINNEINKIKKKDFNEKFNNIFIDKMKTPENDDRLKWFKEDDNNKYDNLTNIKDINDKFDRIRNNKSGLILYNGEFRPLCGGGTNNSGGESFYDERETDENGYITCNPFDKLKYDDITRVHRDQLIIPVENSEFIRANKERNLNEYNKTPDFEITKIQHGIQIFKNQELQHNNIIMEKQHNLQKKISIYEKKNNEILSRFMLLK